ncbi:5-formyltetrahydrofolate cyclo-ligase isoform X2 [Arvicanthis niloticus]|uniref:5-formyltetrahydrofolate cyclo-ligase isoform X2 n=1 Tax=Arvicanthis niloticus TaxID=61156 RepID=UPI001486A567|nr:5-formyltetrahydrofolate cyclo-ligase isoform X2 [Arvicanthis niloticus]
MDHSAAEGDGRGRGGACQEMAAVAVYSAKRSLRAELKQRLRALSAEERLRQSQLLTKKVIAHSQYQNSKRISIFLSMQDEIETVEIIKDIFKQGKVCFIPRYQFQSNRMDMVRLASPEEIAFLPKTSWNIHQPDEGDVWEEALSTGSRHIADTCMESTKLILTSVPWHILSQLLRISSSPHPWYSAFRSALRCHAEDDRGICSSAFAFS